MLILSKAGITTSISYGFSNYTIQFVDMLGTDGVTRGTCQNWALTI